MRLHPVGHMQKACVDSQVPILEGRAVDAQAVRAWQANRSGPVDRAIHCGRSGRSSKGAGAEQAKPRCMTARSSIRGLRPTAGGKAQQFNGHMLQS